MISSQLKAAIEAFAALPVADREAFDQMRPDRKVFKANKEVRAEMDLLTYDAARKAANERRLTGLSKVTTNLVTNEQKHHQIQSNGINALSGDHEVIHKMLTTLLALREYDRQEDKTERDQFQGAVMDSLLKIEERLEALELIH
jgi:hypothetical protein